MDFSYFKKYSPESVTIFNGWFHKSCLEILESVRPPKVAAMLFSIAAHGFHFSLI